MSANKPRFKYRAFITYSHRDKVWADWLHRSLETYPIPQAVRKLTGRDGAVPSRLYPVFRDREELPVSANLSDQIRTSLEDSACLVAICSPHSAGSRYVNEEILNFKRMGREDRILAVIVGGEPNASIKPGMDAAQECFPPALVYTMGPDGRLTGQRLEPLAADARSEGDGKRNAFLKVVAGVLGVGYNVLKRRDEHRRARRQFAVASVVFSALGAGIFYGWDHFDRGTLQADASPMTSTIQVDNAEVGARIRNYSLRSGKHSLMATAPDHHELRRQVVIDRGITSSTRFFLDRALRWSTVSPNLQGGAVLFRDGRDTILAHNEMARVVAFSTATGAEVGAVDTREGQSRTFKEIDLGAGLGKGIITALDRQREGPEIIAIAASLPIRVLWRWEGPATGFRNSWGLAVVALATEPGRPAELAAAGRDGVVRFLDGGTGEMHGEVRFASPPIPDGPALFSGGSPERPVLAVLHGMGHEMATPGESAIGRPLVAVGIDMLSRTVVWRNELGKAWTGSGLEVAIDGIPHLALWNDERWELVDLSSGTSRIGGTLDGSLIGGPGLFDLPGKQGPALVFEYQDPDRPMQAVRAADGSPLWKGPDRLATGFQPRAPNGTGIPRTSAGHLLVKREHSLAAVDAKSGRVVWLADGDPTGILPGDWDGDGQFEIFATLRGGTLVCLDGEGNRRWAARLDNRDAKPWHLVPSYRGGSTSDVLVHVHAGMIGRVQGPAVLWQQTASAAVRATPTVARMPDGRRVVIVAANWGDQVGLCAFNGSDGQLLWSAEERFYDNRGAVLADLNGGGVPEVVILGRRPADDKPLLLTYRVADGKRTRALPLEFTGWAACLPIIADYQGNGRCDVAFSTWDDRGILMADGRTGAIRWHFRTDGPNMGGVAAADLDGNGAADVVVSSGDACFYGLRGSNGDLLWKVPVAESQLAMAGNGLSTPVLADRGGGSGPAIFAISVAGRLFAIAPRTGEVLWKSGIAGGPGICGQPVRVEAEGHTIILTPQSGAGLVAYEAVDGRVLWRSPEGHPVLSTPAIMPSGSGARTRVLFLSLSGYAFAADAADGRILWQDQVLRNVVEADPVLEDLNDDGHPDILIAGHDKIIRALNGLANLGSGSEPRR